jgi:RNA polymerase sigma-70 factor (ECF subfamily)
MSAGKQTSMESDIADICAANNGDKAGYESLYIRHRDWVFNLAWRFTGNREDALDVLQETFIYLLRKFPGFKLTSNLRTFLYPVVKNLSIEFSRKKRRLVASGEVLTELVAPVSKGTNSGEGLAAVLAILPPESREILLMRFVDDLTIEEIAQALGVPGNTIKSRLYRALQTLHGDPRAKKYFLE